VKEVRLALDAGGRKARLGSDRAFSGGAGVITAGKGNRIGAASRLIRLYL
jgi:hypothetical protein